MAVLQCAVPGKLAFPGKLACPGNRISHLRAPNTVHAHLPTVKLSRGSKVAIVLSLRPGDAFTYLFSL